MWALGDQLNQKEEEIISNFRIFNGIGEDNQPIYTNLSTTGGSSQPTVYVLVSIMNALFTYEPSVYYMMKEAEEKYGSANLPITYLCADTLQDITKNYLFNVEAGQDPVEKFRNKWQEKYNKSLAVLKTEHNTINHEILYWQTLEVTPAYQQFKKFTEAVIRPNLTLERLISFFPDVDEGALQRLLQNTKTQEILKNVPLIASNFSSKTYKKMKKAATKESRKATALSMDLKKLGVAMAANYPTEQALQERKENLQTATYSYLAAEYAGLLSLPSLINNNDINPVLSYPISNSNGAEIIFSTYKIIEALYSEFSENLALPKLTQTLTFVDSLVPDHLHPRRQQHKHDVHSKEISSSDISHSNSDDEKYHEKNKLVEGSNSRNNNLTTTVDSALPALSSNTSTFGFSSTTKNLFAHNVTEKIIQKIDMLLNSKANGTRSKYKNGVTCEIKILGPGYAENSSELDNMKELITTAVYNVKNAENHKEDNCEEEEEAVFFNYKGLAFELVITPSEALSNKKSSDISMQRI